MNPKKQNLDPTRPLGDLNPPSLHPPVWLLSAVLAFLVAGCPAKGGDGEDPDAATPDAATTLAVYSVSPANGPVSGGTTVAVSGSGFVEGMTLSFGSAPATELDIVNPGYLTCKTPQGSAGPVTVRAESPDGDTAQLIGGFTYEDRSVVDITWCEFHAPASTTVTVQTATDPLLGRVYAQGVTDGVGQGLGVAAQVGFGPPGTNPASDEGWSWSDAVFHADADDVNDEYSASLTIAYLGDYDLAYRFNGGEKWIYCDLDGSDNGYSSDNAAQLSVTEGSEPMVDWCRLQHPPTLEVDVGTQTEILSGRVFKLGVTEGGGAGDGIQGEAGYGPPGTHPATDPGWIWVPAEYNIDGPVENNDEYIAWFTPNAVGDYDYAFRFSSDEGPWTYCDLNGTDDGYSGDFAGNMTVTGEATGLVDWCNLQYPLTTQTSVGSDTELIFGRVFLEGSTAGGGQGAGVIGQLGYGDADTDPSTDSSWQWVDASYNVSVDGLVPGDMANDEYMATLNVAQGGTYAYAYRFSKDGGSSWLYCDGDGTDNGYDTQEAGSLEVTSSATPSIATITHPRGTVLGGDLVTLSGSGFDAAAEVLFDTDNATVGTASFDTITCTTPPHPAGAVSVTVTNPNNDSDTLADGFEYIHAASLTADGDAGDWDPLLQLATSNVATDATPASLSQLYVAFDADTLYIGIVGLCDTDGSVVAYLDVDYGTGTGVANTEDLSDNSGSLDDAISGTLQITDGGFGAEFAVGTVGMASVTDTIDDAAGLRGLTPTNDLPWLDSTVSTGTDFIEIAIPLATLWPGGVPQTGATMGLVVKLLKDSFGVDYSNQTLPEDPGTDSVAAVATANVFPAGTY